METCKNNIGCVLNSSRPREFLVFWWSPQEPAWDGSVFCAFDRLSLLLDVGICDCWIIYGLYWSVKFVSERDLSVMDLSESIKIPMG